MMNYSSKINKGLILTTLAILVVACSDNPVGNNGIPDINGTWVAETDFLVEKNECSLPNSTFGYKAAGSVLNIWQDPSDRSRVLIGSPELEGTLKKDGTFKTREHREETTYAEFPNGITKVRLWWEGKFSGHSLYIKAIFRITPPDESECEAISSLTANRTTGG